MNYKNYFAVEFFKINGLTVVKGVESVNFKDVEQLAKVVQVFPMNTESAVRIVRLDF